MTGNSIAIVLPFGQSSIPLLGRGVFLSLPLNEHRMEGTWVRAIAVEDKG